MKRRDFFDGFVVAQTDNTLIDDIALTHHERNIQAGLEKHTGVLSRKEAYHLLRRTTFNATPEAVKFIEGKTADEAVAMILGTGNEALPKPPQEKWTNTPEENPLEQIPEIRFQIEGVLWTNYYNFVNWWIYLMQRDELPAIEKFTMFLTTIWTIEFTYDTLALIPSPLLLKNNQTLRRLRLGNYKEIAEEMTLDGAMLLYQSLFYSSGKNPNENYMRELMELFTMGIGNYTEGDIKQGSKVLTGWRTAPYFGQPGFKGYFNTFFSPADHDIGSKTFMGETIPARDAASNTEDQVLNEEVRVLLNIMFSQRSMPIARFVCDKIYRYFVYSNPAGNDNGVIEELANIFVANEFNLKPVYEALFTSKHFYDEGNIGIQIKTPPEFIINFQRQLGIFWQNSLTAIHSLEQELYDPPNVGSWKGYRSWISTKTLPLRYDFAKSMIDSLTNKQLINFGKRINEYQTLDLFIKNLEELFFPKEIDQARHLKYKQKLLQYAETSEDNWGNLIESENDKAAIGIKQLLLSFIKAPDFQLS